MIPKSFVADLNRDVDLVALIGEAVELKITGDTGKGCCPFHAEKTPSFTVSRSRGTYKCFGCGESGGAVSWVMRRDSLTFPEAVRLLAARLGRTVPEGSPRSETAKGEKKGVLAILNAAQGLYARLLEESGPEHPVREELARRGFNLDAARSFGLGFAPDGWATLLNAGIGSAEQLVEAGLVVKRKDSSGYFDLFRNRLVIPIRNEKGEIVSLAGRALGEAGPEGEGRETPKYINGPETSVYRKSGVLFNLDRAMKVVREKKIAIVVEGYFDAMVPSVAGIENVVAPCGTALTEAQLQLLWRFAESVVFCFDADPAGERAAVAAAILALEIMPEGRSASVARLAESDPDGFVRARGPAAFKEVVLAATPVPEFVIDALAPQHELASISAKARFLSRVNALKVADPMLRVLLRKAAAVRAGLSEGEIEALGAVAPEAKAGSEGLRGQNVRTILIPGLVEEGDGEEVREVAGALPSSDSELTASHDQGEVVERSEGGAARQIRGQGDRGTGPASRQPAAPNVESFSQASGWEAFPFQIGKTRFEPEGEGNQEMLAAAHARGLRPLCLCVPASPELVIAKMRFYVLKRMPGSGYRHHPRCLHFAPSDDQSGRALVREAFGADEPGTVTVKIAFAFSRRTGVSLPRGPVNPSGTVTAAEKGLSCGGVLHMLWDEAEFNRWCPKMEGKRSWNVVRKHLLATASQIMAKGSPLSDHLLLPFAHRPGQESQIRQAHEELLKPLFTEDKNGARAVKLFVGELKALETPPTGARLACANFFAHPIHISDSMAGRLLKRYEGAFAMLEAKLEVRLVICATLIAQGELLAADQVFLMLTNRNWIPLSNRYEREVADTMTREGRWFIRPLTYDARSDQPVHSFLLTDTGDVVTPMNILAPGLSPDAIAKREALIAASPGSWAWRVEQREVAPPLPRAHRRSAPLAPAPANLPSAAHASVAN